MRTSFLIDYIDGKILDACSLELIATREVFTCERYSVVFDMIIMTGYERFVFKEHKYDCDEENVKTTLRFLYGKEIKFF